MIYDLFHDGELVYSSQYKKYVEEKIIEMISSGSCGIFEISEDEREKIDGLGYDQEKDWRSSR